MSKSEIMRLIAMIQTFYPGNHSLPTDTDGVNRLVNAWYIMLGDVKNDVAMHNLKNHVKTNKFPPAIADICKPLPKRESADETKLRLEHYERNKPVQTEELKRARDKALADLKKLQSKMIYRGDNDDV